jgi:hypothetical protein
MPKKPRELQIYRIRNPDFYDKAITAYSEKDAAAALGTSDIEAVVDSKLLKKMKRRPGVVFRKLAGMNKDWEAWD